MFSQGRVLQLDNYRVLRSFGWPGVKARRSWKQDKGQAACAQAFVRAIETGTASPIPAAELFEVSRFAIDFAESLA